MFQEHATESTSGDCMPDDSTEETTQSPISTRDETSSEPIAGTSAPIQHNRPRPPKRSLQLSDQAALTNDVLLTVKDHFKRPINQDDCFDIIGKNVAMKLRNLPKRQRLIAEKIINETLFEAEMDNLTLSHNLICQPVPRHFQQQIHHYDSPTPSPTVSIPGTSSPFFPISSTPSPNFPRQTTLQPPTLLVPGQFNISKQQAYPHSSATQSATLIQEQYQEQVYPQQAAGHNDRLVEVSSHEESAASFISSFSSNDA